jgi:hypothetical protein
VFAWTAYQAESLGAGRESQQYIFKKKGKERDRVRGRERRYQSSE